MKTFRRPAPDLPAACAFFPVPLKGQAPMHAPDIPEEIEDRTRLDQRVVVVRQNARRVHERGSLSKRGQQDGAKLLQPLRRLANVRAMLVASGGQVIAGLFTGAMRRAMPRHLLGLAPCKQGVPLLPCQFSPEIHVPRRISTFGVHALGVSSLACP
jgi:hypothetical protein